MINRFKYIAFDDIAANIQNELRAQFMKLHESVEKGQADDIQNVQPAFNGYFEVAIEARTRVIDEIKRGNTDKALNYLEVLYCLMGKVIREGVIARREAAKPL